MGFYLSSKKTGYLTPQQRLSGFLTGFITFAGPLLQMVQLFNTFAGLLIGVPFLYAGSDERLRLLLRLQCGLIFATWIHKLHLSVLTGYPMNIRQPGEVDYMSPCTYLASYTPSLRTPTNITIRLRPLDPPVLRPPSPLRRTPHSFRSNRLRLQLPP